MSDLRNSTTSEQTPSNSIRVNDSSSLGVSRSTDLIRESSSLPLCTVKEEKISEKSKGLTRAHSMSDPQLSLPVTTTQTLSLNSSPVKVHSTNHTPVSSLPPHDISSKSPPVPQPIMGGDRQQSRQNLIKRNDSSDFSLGHSFGFYQPISAPPASASATLVRASTTESLDQSSAATSIDVSPIKLDDDRMKSTLISDVDSSDDDDLSLNDIPRISPQLGGEGGGILSSTTTRVLSPSAVKPPQRRLVWTELESNNQKFSTPTPFLSISAPATKLAVKTSPVSQSLVAPTPLYPAVKLSPVYSSATSNSMRLSPGNANVTLTSPSTFGRGASRTSGVMNESMSRSMLMDKHKKHMDDLKLYYELELTQLRKKMGKLESERNDPSAVTSSSRRSLSPLSPNFASTQRSPLPLALPTTPRQSRQMYFPSSLTKGRHSRSSTGELHCMYCVVCFDDGQD